MKYLVLLSGAPGSGKSSFVKSHELAPYTLSPDTFRLQMKRPMMTLEGEFAIDQSTSKMAWKLMFEELENRMQLGEFVIVDATHTYKKDFQPYSSLVKKHRYRVCVIDFYVENLEILVERNIQRESYKHVPDVVIKRMYQDHLNRAELPTKFDRITPNQFDAKFANVEVDYSSYRAIHHIGDIQGCFTPLMERLQQLQIGDELINNEDLYIFVGDLLDRGPQDGEVLQLMLSIYDLPNVKIIEGNHEKHLFNWAHDLPVRSDMFNQKTKPSIEAVETNKADVRHMCRSMVQVLWYKYHYYNVLVTHGGLPTVPTKLALIPTYELIKGVGKYGDAAACDANFCINTDEHTYQIHGHRNQTCEPIQTNRTFNLEGQVEFNGSLRSVTLDKEGFSTYETRFIQTDMTAEIPTQTNLEFGFDNFGLLSQLRINNLIQEKAFGNISSFNFKRKVFEKRLWSEQTMRARGLYINTQTSEIVIRSFDKFFNSGERQETSGNRLEQFFEYPIKVWKKENGYLGLVGYDTASNELVIASKSSLTSDYAIHFRDMFISALSETQKQALVNRLIKDNVSLVFEVVDPVWDPHIIDYTQPTLILLDAIERTPAFSNKSMDYLMTVGTEVGVAVKTLVNTIDSYKDLQELLHMLTKPTNLLRVSNELEYSEGVVLEGSGGEFLKIKTYYYCHWRLARTHLQLLTNNPRRKFGGDEALLPFFEWYSSSSLESTKQLDLLELRKLYLQHSI